MTSAKPAYPKNLTGVCIGVLSGDRIVFQGPVLKQTGLPIQKVLHLSSIVAPKVDLANGNDEPFGYASREYVRSRLIGKTVPFVIENKVNEIELGHVLFNGADLSISLLRQGLAKIRGDRAKGKNAAEYEEAEAKAQKEFKNLWSDKPEKEPLFSRRVVDRTPKELADLLSGKQVKAVVQEIFPSRITLYFPEIKAIGQIAAPEIQVVVLSEKLENGQSKNNAKEIRSVLEDKVLNREVDVVIRGHTAEGLSGYIKTETFDYRKVMLNFGYAKLSKDALNILDVNEFRDLKTVSQEAQSKGRGLWREHKDQGSKTQSLNQTFVGKVVQVVSGDSVKVLNLEKGDTTRVYLSNVKAPVLGKPFAFEAKEALRKRTIGKKVKVEIEFSKNIKVQRESHDEEKLFVFATIFQGNKNIGATLLQQGLVSLQLPRGDDEFTKYIDELKNADEEAKKKRKGLYGQSVRIPIFNDITSGRDGKHKVDIAKSKAIYNFLKDEKKLTGVVEFVLNGSRFKIRMHQQSCYIILVVQGIRCLPNENQFKKYSEAALQYSKENILQKDVEIELSKIDKKGIFHGTVFVDRQNYALELLERGLAINFGKNPKYEDLESVAKKNKVGLWSTPINLSSLKGNQEREYKAVNFVKNLKLLEVANASEFYLDTLNSDKPEISQKPEPAKEVREDELYAVKFSDDGVYYRAKVRKALKNGQYAVTYIDFGNSENVPASSIGVLTKKEKDAKCHVYRCGLYGVENCNIDATKLLQELIDSDFKVEFKEESTEDYNVILHDKEGTINEEIIANGFGECGAEIAAWQQSEKKAKNNGRGIWRDEQ